MALAIPSDVADACEDKCKDIEHADSVLCDPYAPMHKWPIDMKENALRFLGHAKLEQYELPDESVYPKLRKYMVEQRARNEALMFRLRREEDELRFMESDEYKLEKAREKHERIQQLLKVQQDQYNAVFKKIQDLTTELHATYLVCLDLERKITHSTM